MSLSPLALSTRPNIHTGRGASLSALCFRVFAFYHWLFITWILYRYWIPEQRAQGIFFFSFPFLFVSPLTCFLFLSLRSFSLLAALSLSATRSLFLSLSIFFIILCSFVLPPPSLFRFLPFLCSYFYSFACILYGCHSLICIIYFFRFYMIYMIVFSHYLNCRWALYQYAAVWEARPWELPCELSPSKDGVTCDSWSSSLPGGGFLDGAVPPAGAAGGKGCVLGRWLWSARDPTM